MRRGLTIAAVVMSSAAVIGLGVGCGSSDSASNTPGDATTIANSALQTDSQGKTVSAPASDGGGATAGGGAATAATPAGGGGDAAGGAGGDAAAGKAVFEANCQGCHPAGGTQAGVGPQLSVTKLDSAAIKMQVMNGKGAMPGGLVSGTDLDNVVAYVDSIKQ